MTKLTSFILGAAIAGASLSTHASTDLDLELSRCAEAALATQQVSVKKIRVETPTDDAALMDHDLSQRVTEYRMRIASDISGQELGNVTCRISKSGEVTSAKFDA